MEIDQSGTSIEDQVLSAVRLVSALDAREFLVLIGLGNGMSKKAIAAASNLTLEDVEGNLASLMKKLSARTIADAVRIAIYANLSLHH